MQLLAELLGDKDQVENVDDAVAVGVWGGLAEAVGDLHQIQDVDLSIAVDVGAAFGLEVDSPSRSGSR